MMFLTVTIFIYSILVVIYNYTFITIIHNPFRNRFCTHETSRNHSHVSIQAVSYIN